MSTKYLSPCLGVMFFVLVQSAFGQDGMTTLPLNDLSEFKPQAGNWMMASEVRIDRSIDVHQKPAQDQSKSKKKKSAPEPVNPVSYTPGAGILLNLNSDEKHDALVTTWEHGDIELELEFMVPKGSNSGIYLQGRYEVQIFDSWGVKDPSFSDIGGIYRNWESDPSTAYMGKAPLTNAAKAPGLWQKLKISFTAPKFDAAGKKVANARFNYVDLNGVRIHENIEVPQMTGGPIFDKEGAAGPLMIQGDHGAVAFRNIRYKLLADLDFGVSDLSYEAFAGVFDSEDDLAGIKPFKTGNANGLTWEVAGDENTFAIRIKGNFNVPKSDNYTFTLVSSRNAQLKIKDQTVSQYGWAETSGTPIRLESGKVPFELLYFKDEAWFNPRLGLLVSTSTTHPKELQTFNSYPVSEQVTAPIFVSVGSEPRLLRAFLDFQNDPDKRLTHTIGVGDPSGIHYVYDMKAGTISCVWKGDFVDATPMWHDRGDGSFRPVGAVQFMFRGPSIGQEFPLVANENEFKGKGYSIDQDGRPVFSYTLNGIDVKDRVYPIDGGKSLRREVSISNFESASLNFKIAEGSRIEKLPDGSYVVDDAYYIVCGQPVTIRDSGDKKELLCPVSSTIQYDIIW